MSFKSIKDKPIEKNDQDALQMERYISALAEFITESDTPITIGLQGEWGTGKTSMMYMLREQLERKNIATSWINTWEYSMFRGVKETTPAVMRGLLENLESSTLEKAKNFWQKDDVKKTAEKVGRFFFNVVNQVVANQTGIQLKESYSDDQRNNGTENKAQIAEVKKDISNIIKNLVSDSSNEFKRVVFFVDDLDRINPTDAVEILESLKNIFDIENCIFILAIDYDVVIKGLEGKFGKKTDANEREFRSFFDKIIQVPFSMPTGAYDIDGFLKTKFADIGLKNFENSLSSYLAIVKYSVGYNPRSLKRFLNTFSLINLIRSKEEKDSPEIDDDNMESATQDKTELMLFALLGIQISYPIIFRYLSVDPLFKDWNEEFAAKNGLDFQKIEERIKDFGQTELTNDTWEKVVWGFCQNDSYMKSRAISVLELLNLLIKEFDENLGQHLQSAMEFAAITSVDDNQESRQAITKVGNKYVFNGMIAKIEELLKNNSNKKAVDLWEHYFQTIEKHFSMDNYHVSYLSKSSSLYSNKNKLLLLWNPPKKDPAIIGWMILGGKNNVLDFTEFTNQQGVELGKSIKIHKCKPEEPGWVGFDLGLIKEMGEEKYTDFMKKALDKFIEYHT